MRFTNEDMGFSFFVIEVLSSAKEPSKGSVIVHFMNAPS